MGTTIFGAALIGGAGPHYLLNRILLAVFALPALAAALKIGFSAVMV